MEVALAATVLALTLVGMIQVVESGSEMLDLSRKQTLATQLLHSELDSLRLQSWATLTGFSTVNAALNGPPAVYGYASTATLTASNDPVFATFAAGQNYPQAANIFTLTRYVACVDPNQPNPNPLAHYSNPPLLIQVTFTISWTGVTGHSYTRTATTLVAYNGLSISYQRS